MKKQSTTKGFAILSFAGLLSKILSLLYLPFILRILGGEGYGVYRAAYTIYVFIYVLANSGIPVAISKMVSELSALEDYKDMDAAFKLTRIVMLLIGVALTLFMIVFAGKLSELVHFKKSYWSIVALAPTVLFTVISSSYRGYYQGRNNMTPTAVSQIIEQIANTIFTLVFAAIFIKYGIEAASAGATIGSAVGAFISAVYLMYLYEKHKKNAVYADIKKSSKRRHSGKQLLKRLIAYSVPITICVGSQNLGNVIDLSNTKARLLFAGIADAKASALYGDLTMYQQLINVPITIIAALSAAILPVIASSHALKNKKEVSRSIDYSFRTCFLISIPSAFGLAVLAKPIYVFIFGFAHSEGAYLMTMGSFVLVMMAIVQIQATILQSVNKMYSTTIYIMIGLFMKIAVNYVLIGKPSINIKGAIYGSFVCFVIPIIANHRTIIKTLKIRFHLFKHSVKPTVASVFMCIVAYLVWYDLNFVLGFIMGKYAANALAVLSAVAAGGFTYLFALILNGGITKEDMKTVPNRFIKLIPKSLYQRIR